MIDSGVVPKLVSLLGSTEVNILVSGQVVFTGFVITALCETNADFKWVNNFFICIYNSQRSQ